MQTIEADDGKTFSVKAGGFILVDADHGPCVRVAISRSQHELECAYLSPDRALALAAALIAEARTTYDSPAEFIGDTPISIIDTYSPLAALEDGGESHDLIKVMPGMTVDLSKQTTEGTAPHGSPIYWSQVGTACKNSRHGECDDTTCVCFCHDEGTAPKISASCASHSHVECGSCACICHNPPPAPPRRDPADTVDYLAEMRHYLEDTRHMNDALPDNIIMWLVAEAAIDGINSQDAAREWLANEPEYAEELARLEEIDDDTWPAWPFDRQEDAAPAFDAPRFVPGGDNRYND